MKFVADENVDGPIVSRLREGGHEVWYIAELEPGIDDEWILALANRENTLLITADRDFGELVFRMRQATAGVLLIRLAGCSSVEKAVLVERAIAEYGSEMAGAFAVLSTTSIRIRRLSD